MCCDGRAYDFSNQDRVIGTWTEIWKCLCLDLAQGEHEQGAEAAAGPQCLCPLMAGFGQRDKSTFTRQQQLAGRPRVSVCPGCRAAPQGHYRWVCPKGSRCLGNGTRERTACSQLVPAASPQGTPRRDPPHQTRWEKGVSTAELSAWKFGGAWAKDACAVWVLPLLRLYLSVLKGRMARAHWTSCCSYIYFMLSLFCLFPFFIFLVALQTLTWRPNYPCLSWSFLSLLLCTSSSEWDLVCRILGTPIKQGLLTLLYKLVDIDTYTHFEHSLWASGPAFSSSVCGQKCWVQKMDLTNLICKSWCLSPLEIWIQSLSHPSKPEQHPGSNSIWEIWLKKGLKNSWTRTFDKGLEW